MYSYEEKILISLALFIIYLFIIQSNLILILLLLVIALGIWDFYSFYKSDDLELGTIELNENIDYLDIANPNSERGPFIRITSLEMVSDRAKCPFCQSQIRESLNELGGTIKCLKCGRYQHSHCVFENDNRCNYCNRQLRIIN